MTPDMDTTWYKDAVFYQIFPDRFACSERVPKPSNLEPWDSPPTVFSFKGGDLLAFFRRAIALRRDHPALRRGRYVRLYASHRCNVYAFARQTEEETLVVVLNNSSASYELNVPVRGLVSGGTVLRDLWGGGEARVTAGRITAATLLPRSGAVLAVGTPAMGGRSMLSDK